MLSTSSWLRRLVLIGIPVLFCVLSQLGHLRLIENQLLDLRFRFRGELDSTVQPIYVDIDNKAIQTYRWPWNHRRYAQLLDALFDHGNVKAVGFDIVFSENSKADFGIQEQAEGRLLFGKAIRRHGNVVLAANYVPGPGLIQEHREFPWVFDGFTDPQKNDTPELPAFPVLGPSWGIPGLIDTYLAESRLAPIFAESPVGTFHPFALRLALIHWGLTPEAITRFADRLEIRRPSGELVTRIPLQRGQLVECNWFSHWISPKNPRCSVIDLGENLSLLESDSPEEQALGKAFFAQFRDAVVLIGAVDPLLQDLGRTPFDDEPVPQVGFHGNLVKTFTSGIHLRRLPDAVNHAITFALCLVIGLLARLQASSHLRPRLAALILAACYIMLAFLSFKIEHFVLPMTAPLGAGLITGLFAVSWQLLDEQKAKVHIKSLFGTYVSPQLVEQMIDSGETPQLGGREAEITAFFSDIQAFSQFSEILAPSKLVELMNEYLTECTEIVLAEGAALDKYIGDAMVAMFGGLVPLDDHAYRACVASQRIQLRLGELRKKWRAEGDKWPPIVGHMQTRIGLNSGLVTLGNMGSPSRFNFTMMGDNVNLAARMESGAKAYGVFSMVTEATHLACRQHGGDHVVFRNLDRMIVKGRSLPVSIYEVVGLRESVTDQALECIDFFSMGLRAYQMMDWDTAETCFRRSASLERHQPGPAFASNPSIVLLERCAQLRNEPPAGDWDGVYVMRGK
jgi:adenylate cyclase